MSSTTNKNIEKLRKLKKDVEQVLALRDKLNRAARTFTGEDWAGAVIAWFNDDDCRPDDPVRKLWDRACRPYAYPGSDTVRFVEMLERRWKLHFVRTIARTPEGPKLDLAPAWTGNRSKKAMLAWNDAVLLWSHGLLDRIRVCARAGCGVLFYAKFKHTEYHHLACRKAVETSDPEYLTKQREHMRKIRQQKGRKP